jgi:hypothetical protein
MRRPVVALLTAVLLAVVSLPGGAAAAKPADPYVSRVTGTARWLTDSDGGSSYYVLWVTLYARNVTTGNTECVTVTYPDGTRNASSGTTFPRVARGAEASVDLQLLEIPLTASRVTVTAQVMRLSAKGCCIPVGTKRVFTQDLPEPPPPPPAVSAPVPVFDVRYSAP